MNGIDTILRRLDTDAKAEADAVLKKARQEAADITARYQAQAAQEAARLAARNEKAAEEREERLVSAAQMEGRKTILAAKQTVMEQVYDKALEKLLSLPRTQYIEVLAALLALGPDDIALFDCRHDPWEILERCHAPLPECGADYTVALALAMSEVPG